MIDQPKHTFSIDQIREAFSVKLPEFNDVPVKALEYYGVMDHVEAGLGRHGASADPGSLCGLNDDLSVHIREHGRRLEVDANISQRFAATIVSDHESFCSEFDVALARRLGDGFRIGEVADRPHGMGAFEKVCEIQKRNRFGDFEDIGMVQIVPAGFVQVETRQFPESAKDFSSGEERKNGIRIGMEITAAFLEAAHIVERKLTEPMELELVGEPLKLEKKESSFQSLSGPNLTNTMLNLREQVQEAIDEIDKSGLPDEGKRTLLEALAQEVVDAQKIIDVKKIQMDIKSKLGSSATECPDRPKP